MSEQMTRRDRDQLAQVAKMRARVARSSIEGRELALKSQVEDELQALFDAENDMKARAMEIANVVARRAQVDLTEKLEESGILERFRPAMGVVDPDMMNRGNDSNGARRVTMRTIAAARLKALAAAARVEIDRQCADTVTALVAGGLTGDDAQAFLDAMPTIDQLMLAPSVAELEAAHDEQRRSRRSLERGWS